jgi:hypothetical protein
MFSLAMAAACAVIALVGSATASAGIHESIGFCKANEGLLCAAGNLLAGGALKVHAAQSELRNNASFSTSLICESDMSVTAAAIMKSPIKGTIPSPSGVTFTNCTGNCTTATATNLPWEVELKMTTPGGTAYELFTKKGGALLSGCTFGATCEYGVPAAGITLKGENVAEGGQIKAVGISLEYKSGSGSFICGSSATWTATCTASPAKSWYFTLLGTANTES